MSWSAEQVYTIANTTVIERLQQIEELRQGLFKIDTLEKGIRSEWTREIFFENEHHERKHIKHSLPQDGLFVINPSMSRTAYDDKANAFYASYAEYKKNKWQFLEHIEIVPMVLSLNLTLEQCKLLAFLQQLNEETKQPFVYYKCEMWGGDIDEEIAVVFDGEMKVYYFDELAGEYKQMIGAEIKELEDTTALQKGLEAIGLVLPTHFFALHETFFDWYPYQVRH
ncbi:hypothetical protein HX082_14715 [Myroides odoratimimus]|uniref:hypothetical protein n=1 Tax=Myroides odoratimimus TaxID=76832 RepID=UPI002575ECA4|nr:hypothetical protein [Myroides odoratimimus]MDM1066297.1 hypothetical protein [Myroides odoratimimus]MDM1327266.1 hypothetical protein [Myroides odoratimimus]MDM1506682.1 hypothetical protein [Myroides odoratimimus]MDM1510627.1 hypothetical protein [Myroides odoratimimus]MDM1526201.1 hypothetical protein [Myroides odoratimimus]